jgi:8-amino-7-oxononanoate synthase
MTALERLVTRQDQSLYCLVKGLKRKRLIAQRASARGDLAVRSNGRRLRNFTSSNYLGLADHPAVRLSASRAALQWGVSLSQPRLWVTDRITARLELEIARLVGQEQAITFPSTTHIAYDVLPLLAGKRGAIFMDAWAYPISKAGAHAARQMGARIYIFRHNDPQDLAHLLESEVAANDKVIVCDGLYMSVGEPAALSAFQDLADVFDAVIYLDDAQGLGILGSGPCQSMPYGYGGGGTPQYWNTTPGRIVHASTLAKAFGVPIAFVAGPKGFIDYLGSTGSTFFHSSPPALPVLAAALGALQLNAVFGDRLRSRLLNRVRYFHHTLDGFSPGLLSDHLFPMQSIYFSTSNAATSTAGHLRRHNIWPIIQFGPPENPFGGVLRFILTISHRSDHIDELSRVLKAVYNCKERIG